MKSALKITTAGDRELVITRVFDAPRTVVYDAHTKPGRARGSPAGKQ